MQDPTYLDDQITMIEDRIKKLMDELNERNEETDFLKDEASKQIDQIRGSITKFLDRETGTLSERIRTLFKEQGITIVSILIAVGMAIGVLIIFIIFYQEVLQCLLLHQAIPVVVIEKVVGLESG